MVHTTKINDDNNNSWYPELITIERKIVLSFYHIKPTLYRFKLLNHKLIKI